MYFFNKVDMTFFHFFSSILVLTKAWAIDKMGLWAECWVRNFDMVIVKVVKIAFWLIKSYDFTSQNMLYVLNRLKKIKNGWNRVEITKNRDFRIDFTISPKLMHGSKMFPHAPTVRRLLVVQMHSHAAWQSLHSSLQSQKRRTNQSITPSPPFHRTNP
jgi:hypothetical protein